MIVRISWCIVVSAWMPGACASDDARGGDDGASTGSAGDAPEASRSGANTDQVERFRSCAKDALSPTDFEEVSFAYDPEEIGGRLDALYENPAGTAEVEVTVTGIEFTTGGGANVVRRIMADPDPDDNAPESAAAEEARLLVLACLDEVWGCGFRMGGMPCP